MPPIRRLPFARSSGSRRTSPSCQLRPWFRQLSVLFDASSEGVCSRSSSGHPPAPGPAAGTSLPTLTTTALDCSSSDRFGTRLLKTNADVPTRLYIFRYDRNKSRLMSRLGKMPVFRRTHPIPQMLGSQVMPTCNVSNHCPSRHRLCNNPALFLCAPAPPAHYPGYFATSPHSRLRAVINDVSNVVHMEIRNPAPSSGPAGVINPMGSGHRLQGVDRDHQRACAWRTVRAARQGATRQPP